MTAQPRTIRTEAEQGLLDNFERLHDALPGGSLVRARRQAAIAFFRDKGLPHRRVEEWKYTDLRALMRKAAPPVISAVLRARTGSSSRGLTCPSAALSQDGGFSKA
jgi:Fe-S cluster assembly protein SufD